MTSSSQRSPSTSYAPKCPNHGVPLIRTSDKGIGICPISDARFAYEANENESKIETRINKFGQLETVKEYTVINIDGKEQ